ncbi:PREDICTED: urotensin-2B [Dipodomys ordii]|uniref:Urotensin-2B n=1 Tax=Dipodomys ordii TaxID=10020 RepID=A0A1S3FFC7_DIPOR|nr:PREDICTED: urotensin-2B [Dipodomys ordii]
MKLSTPLCFGLLTFVSGMIVLESVHGRPYLTQGSKLFPDKEDSNLEEVLLALLKKNFDFQNPANIDVGLAHKLEELNQLEKRDHFMEAKDAEMSYAMDGLASSHPNKRACFWKYCV